MRAVNPPGQASVGRLRIDLPSFRTLEELRAWGEPEDKAEGFFLFEKEESKVAVIVRINEGIFAWNKIIIYEFNAVQNKWVPCAYLDPWAAEVRVSFDKRRGLINIRSSKGVLIFTANIEALKGRDTYFW
jgi:hypothetical protein